MQNGKAAQGDGAGMLPYNFFSNLLALEEQMVTQTYTVDTINSLVAQYAKCIEFYDLRKDPIKHYFMEKIQLTLANKDALKVMMQSKKKEGDRRKSLQKPPPTPIQEKVDEEEEDENTKRKKKSPRSSTNGRKKSGEGGTSPKNGETGSPRDSLNGPKRYSLTDKKKERARQISYMLKIENIKSTVEKKAGEEGGAENIIIDLATIVSNFKKNSEQNDLAVRQELENQEKAFKLKLDAKRKLHHWNRINRSRTSSFSEDLPMLRSASATSVLLPMRLKQDFGDSMSPVPPKDSREISPVLSKENSEIKAPFSPVQPPSEKSAEPPVESKFELKVDPPVETQVQPPAHKEQPVAPPQENNPTTEPVATKENNENTESTQPPAETKVEAPVEKPVEQPVQPPPVEVKVEAPVEKPAEQPAPLPAEPKAEVPVEKPVEAPAQKEEPVQPAPPKENIANSEPVQPPAQNDA